jgi:hypothetical protein
MADRKRASGTPDICKSFIFAPIPQGRLAGISGTSVDSMNVGKLWFSFPEYESHQGKIYTFHKENK